MLLLTAVASSTAVSTGLFVFDFLEGIDLRDAKYRGKLAVKKGATASEGVDPDHLQAEAVLAGILGAVILLSSLSALYPVVRSRRMHQRTKLALAGSGVLVGLGLIVPVRATLLLVVRLLM